MGSYFRYDDGDNITQDKYILCITEWEEYQLYNI